MCIGSLRETWTGQRPWNPRKRVSNALIEVTNCFVLDFVADNPGMTLFHCHQQLHMDLGFMALFNYAQCTLPGRAE
jgi:FtsP/CotA-like multicopper oxidase with cupredoxin domain